MAKTEYIFLKGKAKWAYTTKPDKYNKWKIVLYPDADSLAIIKELQEKGLKNKLAKDEDGYYMTFSRPTMRNFKNGPQALMPPEVIQADGKTPLTQALIGNGSDVTIKLECYSFKNLLGGEGAQAVAARLLSIRVDTLVPYEMKRDFDADQEKLVRDLADQPPQQQYF